MSGPVTEAPALNDQEIDAGTEQEQEQPAPVDESQAGAINGALGGDAKVTRQLLESAARLFTGAAEEPPEEKFDLWFRSLPDLDTRCFAIALAAFHGLPAEYVAEAAVKLRAILEPRV